MKVGILTFHASHNYGSMLQAYALQQTLVKLGVDNRIINFRSDIQKSLIPPPLQWCHPRSSLSKLIQKPADTLAQIRKYRRFERFLKLNLNVSEELNTEKEVANHVIRSGYDAIITGSDQIWNPGCWDFSTVYLCDFPFQGRKIAYAPSLGSNPEEITGSDQEIITGLASEYDSLSTREVRGSSFIESRLGRNVDVVLDPTLLLKAEDYESISATDKINRPYILYYTPREEKGMFRSALALSDKLGLDIIVTQDYGEYHGYRNVIFKLDCGPREFLSLIKDASYCIGNSFHLLAFSLIFHREFLLLSHEKDSRMTSILSSLNITERLIHPEQSFTVPERIDYYTVDKLMTEIKVNSRTYLYTALNHQ